MIAITVYQNSKGHKMGFKSKGHAGFADSGYDIICAGVSALVINFINLLKNCVMLSTVLIQTKRQV